MNRRTAIVVGASGLVGKQVLDILLADDYYRTVVSMTRREQDLQADRLMQYVLDYERLDEVEELIAATDIYCCLGTTMKKAGSKEAFRKVDHDYVLDIAKIARKNDAQQFLLVSSIGANAKSKNFYGSVKGEVEEGLKEIGFPKLHIFRPSVLTGDREESRPSEKMSATMGNILKPVLVGGFKKYRPISGRVVAKTMYEIAKKDRDGVHVYESNQIQQLGG